MVIELKVVVMVVVFGTHPICRSPPWPATCLLGWRGPPLGPSGPSPPPPRRANAPCTGPGSPRPSSPAFWFRVCACRVCACVASCAGGLANVCASVSRVRIRTSGTRPSCAGVRGRPATASRPGTALSCVRPHRYLSKKKEVGTPSRVGGCSYLGTGQLLRKFPISCSLS